MAGGGAAEDSSSQFKQQQCTLTLFHWLSSSLDCSWCPLRGHCLSHGLPALGDKQIPALGHGHQETSHIVTIHLAYTIIPAHGKQEC